MTQAIACGALDPRCLCVTIVLAVHMHAPAGSPTRLASVQVLWSIRTSPMAVRTEPLALDMQGSVSAVKDLLEGHLLHHHHAGGLGWVWAGPGEDECT